MRPVFVLTVWCLDWRRGGGLAVDGLLVDRGLRMWMGLRRELWAE